MSKKTRHKALKALETTSTKACSVCLEIKSIAEFSPDCTGRKNLLSRCKSCVREYNRKRGVEDIRKLKWLELRDKEGGDEKACKGCLTIKSLSAFHNNKGSRKGRVTLCKECSQSNSQRQHLKKKYDLTIEQYDQMLEQQSGCCDICGTDTPKHAGRFVVDHNHKTGRVRALLCSACNSGLGFFKDNPNVLRRAARYLETQ